MHDDPDSSQRLSSASRSPVSVPSALHGSGHNRLFLAAKRFDIQQLVTKYTPRSYPRLPKLTTFRRVPICTHARVRMRFRAPSLTQVFV